MGQLGSVQDGRRQTVGGGGDIETQRRDRRRDERRERYWCRGNGREEKASRELLTTGREAGHGLENTASGVGYGYGCSCGVLI